MAANHEIDQVVLLLIGGIAAEAAEHACIARMGMTPADARSALDEARRRITIAADYTRQEQVGTAVIRLNQLYSKAIQAKDVRVALQAQRELNRLLGLYGDQQPLADGPVDAEGLRSELDAIAGHLLPLKLIDAGLPLSEHARVASGIVSEARVPKART